MVRFKKRAFLPPLMCEPVIYLYPRQAREVITRVAPEGGISASSPRYGDGWKVAADLSGRITHAATGKVFPYLFREGPTWIYQMPKKGFVVERARIETFLREVLPQLGLAGRDVDDLIAAWAPKLSAASYALITFVPQETIDRLAPIAIDAPPQTLILVLMDWKPLEAPIEVPPPAIDRPPERRGFTAVDGQR